MRRHWQKKPLLVRQAVPGLGAAARAAATLFALAAQRGRRVAPGRARTPQAGSCATARSRGARCRRCTQPGWTLLVQGVDLHDERVHALLQQFRFRARRAAGRPDDQLRQRRRRRRPAFRQLRRVPAAGAGPPALAHRPAARPAAAGRTCRSRSCATSSRSKSFVLEPGDMLYLPPRYAHDGVAVGGDCMTCSIGLRAPARAELARRPAGAHRRGAGRGARGRAAMPARTTPTRRKARSRRRPPCRLRCRPSRARRCAPHCAIRQAIDRALGESLTEPKAHVWFESGRCATRRGSARAARPPHAHALRRAASLHQRRKLSRFRAAMRR